MYEAWFVTYGFSAVPRDIKERGRDLDQVLTQYMTFVKPAFDEFCSPVRIWAFSIVLWFLIYSFRILDQEIRWRYHS